MFKSLFNLFFPQLCLGCGSFIQSNENVICTSCRHELPLTNHHLETENEIIKKFYGRIPIEFGAAMIYFHKRGIVQELIHNLKYRSHQEIGTMLGQWYAEDLKTLEIAKNFNVIIPVPLHKKRLKERGYNQVEEFGRALASILAIEYDGTILHRNFHTKTQTKKSFFGRTEIKKNLFDVTFTEAHYNKHFLLIDDVITSGTTIEACAKALLKIPGAKISIVAMAYTY
ncbi:ComF family protein [Flavobacterium sp. WW92]|uniref:ComF family protein n=1 Tax=unclassified Flavobacterium TaxID=196869 RepID=UPI0022252281|nr:MULTISPECIES: ComF family protein [unclassified Flavobacterium]WDO13593.1 ComF family protein [Flavobacterium sp. WW92]